MTTQWTHDPVCGMQVDATRAAATSEYAGTTYYFCSPGCKNQFDKQPERYVQQAQGHGEADPHHGHSC